MALEVEATHGGNAAIARHGDDPTTRDRRPRRPARTNFKIIDKFEATPVEQPIFRRRVLSLQPLLFRRLHLLPKPESRLGVAAGPLKSILILLGLRLIQRSDTECSAVGGPIRQACLRIGGHRHSQSANIDVQPSLRLIVGNQLNLRPVT